MAESKVRVELQQSIVCVDQPAKIRVYDGDKLVTVVNATVEGQDGADGGRYPGVKLTTVESIQSELQELVQAFLRSNPNSERELANEFGASLGTIKRWASGTSAPHPLGCQPVIDYLKKKTGK